MRPRIRFRGPVGALGGYGLGLDMAPEKHYLQLDGSVDFGYADGGAAGVESGSDGWTLIVKINGRSLSNVGIYATAYDELGNFPRQSCQYIYSRTSGRVGNEGQHSVTGLLYTRELTDETMLDVQVIASAHRNTVTRRNDIYIARAGGTLQTSGGSFTKSEARSPLHVGFGGYLTRQTGAHTSPGGKCAASLVAGVLVSGLVTEAQVQRYSLAADARAVWPLSQIWGYWPMSLTYLDGATWKTRNLGSGTGQVPITWVGPTGADLVRL